MSEEKKLDETPVEAFSLEGLNVLKNAGLIDDVRDKKHLVCAWPSDRVHFNETGQVTFLNFGGKRLHRGFPYSEAFILFPSLRSLNLGGTDLSLTGTEVVLSKVANSTVESIHIGGNGLGNEGAKAIGMWLVGKPARLLKVDFRYNDIGDEGMAALCQGLVDSDVIYFHMEGNAIGNAGCLALSTLLNHGSCKLAEVFLGANKIGAAGAAHLASSLLTNTTLSKLYLEGNNIGLEGATAFSEVLEELTTHKTLKHLYVDNNNIGKEGSQRLSKALNSSTSFSDGF